MFRQLVLQPVAQRGQPPELVCVFVGANLLPVGDVDADHAHVAYRRGDHALLLVVETGDAVLHVADRFATQDRNAVIGLLAAEHRTIARRLKLGLREVGVLLLGLLQAQRIDRIRREPVQHMRQAHLQRVDIPGRELHGATAPAGATALAASFAAAGAVVRGRYGATFG